MIDYHKLATELFNQMAKCPKASFDEPRNFSRGEVGILIYLHSTKNGVTSGTLSECLTVSTGRIATALKSLEKKGFIERHYNDPSDKRKVLVYITEAGRDFVIEGHQKGIKKTEDILRKLGEEDAKEFVRIVKRIMS